MRLLAPALGGYLGYFLISGTWAMAKLREPSDLFILGRLSTQTARHKKEKRKIGRVGGRKGIVLHRLIVSARAHLKSRAAPATVACSPS